MTNEELQTVVSAVIQALKTNGKTIDQLTPVTSLANSDSLEVSGGKKIAFSKLKELVASAVVVTEESIKSWVVIESTDALPVEPTTEEQMKAYVLADKSTLYVYVGEGGDTLNGSYQSVIMKGEDGKTGPKGDSGVSLGDVVLVNDLTTGGEVNALSAEMGKVLAESCGVKKDVFTQTLGYNIFPAKGDYPIMIAGKTYSIHIHGDKPMGQTQWELWGRTESGTALIQKLGNTDISVEQVITYTPAADIYAIGCNYSIDVQDTTVMITYQIDYGTYHSEYERRLEALDEVLQYGTAIIIDVSGIQKISNNAPYWVYKQRIPIMFAGGTYKITVTAGAVIPSSQKWELWCADYDLTSSTRVKLFEITGVDMSIGASFMVTATQDIYSLYCGYQNAGLGSTITMAYKVEQAKESQRLHDIEDDVRACEDAISSAGINRFDSYYRLGATENDTINLITRPIGLIVMGQSNADGRIPNSSFPSTATIDTTDDLALSKQLDHCLFMKGDKESTYSEPIKNFAARNNSGNWAFDDIVYNAVNHALGGNTDFYVIKQTRGATGIRLANGSFNANVNDFVKNGYAISQLYHFKLLIERALELNPNIDFKAILWHQGEAEWEVTEEGLYYECLCQIIYWLRGKVGNPKLPFIFGTVPTDSEQYSAVVKADMEKVAQDINDCYLIDLGAAGDMIDQYHFGASTAERLAREMYKIMRQNYMLAPMIKPL